MRLRTTLCRQQCQRQEQMYCKLAVGADQKPGPPCEAGSIGRIGCSGKRPPLPMAATAKRFSTMISVSISACEAQTEIMTSTSWIFSPSSVPPATPGELITDYRSRLALEQFQAAERRKSELAEQSSALNAPEVRIRAWEKAHGLRLPADPAHPVLRFVSAVTRLTLDQVHAEQERRLALAHQTAAPSEQG